MCDLILKPPVCILSAKKPQESTLELTVVETSLPLLWEVKTRVKITS